MSTSTVKLAGVVATYVAAVNAFDEDAVVATFAGDVLVNDVHREFSGKDGSAAGSARRSSATVPVPV
jgi:hypothetical protein